MLRFSALRLIVFCIILLAALVIGSPMPTQAIETGFSWVGVTFFLELNNDDNPVMLAYTGYSAELVLCNDPFCNGGDEEKIVAGSDDIYDLTVDQTGSPVILSTTGRGFDLRRCVDPECSNHHIYGGWQRPRFLESELIFGHKLSLDADGNPVVIYSHSMDYYGPGPYRLRLLHCNDHVCQGNDESLVTIDTSPIFMNSSALTMGADGNPVIAYVTRTPFSLKLLRCNDPNCEGGDDIPSTVISTQIYNETLISLALDRNDNPIFAYLKYNEPHWEVWITSCNDPACLGDDESHVSLGNIKNYDSLIHLKLDRVGNPVILFEALEGEDTLFRLINCNDSSCAGQNEFSTIPLPKQPFNSRILDAEITADGTPIFTYLSSGRSKIWRHAPGVSITESDGSTLISEPATAADSYTITLQDVPLTDIGLNVTAEPQCEISLDGSTYSQQQTASFTALNWTTPQTVTVRALEDQEDEGTHACLMTHEITGYVRSGYRSIDVPDVVAQISDDADTGLAAPSNLDGNGASFTVDVHWRDNSHSESGFILERSSNGVTNWSAIATLPANSTAYRDSLDACSILYYRVRSFNSGHTSNYSNVIGVPVTYCGLFTDVPVEGKEWMQPWIESFYEAGITTGCPGTALTYCPEASVTRGAMAIFLLRALHYPNLPYIPPARSGSFADLPVDGKEWMEPWIEEFYQLGITTGCAQEPLSFCPETPVTRGTMAVFLLRAKYGKDYVPPVEEGLFADAPTGSQAWMTPWIEQLYRAGITVGCAENPLRYCPDAPITRAAMAVFVQRAFSYLPKP